MATVAQVAKASLQRILVQASEAELEPDEYQDFIFAMNNFMLSLDADGVSLGYTEVMPSTLSIGSGNESDDQGLTTGFYPNQEASILAETTGAIGLEQNTNKTT